MVENDLPNKTVFVEVPDSDSESSFLDAPAPLDDDDLALVLRENGDIFLDGISTRVGQKRMAPAPVTQLQKEV